MTTIGYCRVSTDGQSLAAQEAALREAGCTKLFAEKASGAKSDRAQLAKAIAALGKGDVLIVTRLDRLARSTCDLLNTLHTIAAAGAGFKSLADTWADTTTMHGRLMLTVLGGLAEFERELIKARTSDGRKRAQARGVKFGRPAKLTLHQRREAIARLQACETQADVACTHGVAHTTIGRLRHRPETFSALRHRALDLTLGVRRACRTERRFSLIAATAALSWPVSMACTHISSGC